MSFTAANGLGFGMQSISFAGLTGFTPTISLVGSLAGGGTVTQNCAAPPVDAFGNPTGYSACALTAFAGRSFSAVQLTALDANGFPAVQFTDVRFTPAVVPEPTTVALLGAGLLAVGAAARRRRA